MDRDPMRTFMEVYGPASRAHDWGAQVDAATELVRRTAAEVFRTIDVPEPPARTVVALLAVAKEEASSRVDRFANAPFRDPMPRLNDLYRAVWWLARSLPAVREDGSLAADAPYSNSGHLMRSLYGAADQVLRTCPPPPRLVPHYSSASPAGDAVSAAIEAADDEDLEGWWAAGHSLERVDSGVWSTPRAVLAVAGRWGDIIQVQELETDLYSDRFRVAVEIERRKGDTHAWLPVDVVSGAEHRPYWLLNVWGSAAKDTWGLRADLTADRTVVLPYAGDSGPLFAARATVAADAAGLAVAWRVER